MDVQLVTKIAERLCEAESWTPPAFIDAGASGAVFEVAHPTHGPVALKVYDPSFFQGDHAVIEEKRIELQAATTGLNHANLIVTYSAAKLEKEGTWYILMQYCPWPSLQKALSGVPVEEIQNLIKQLAEVVVYLRDHDIIHRDIKPANIAISPDFKSLMLLDLGVMRSISVGEGNGTDLDEKKRFIATAQYSPPEYITRNEDEGTKGFEALNIYQVGAVLHDLIMKRPLFNEEAESLNRYRLYSAIVQKVPLISNPAVPARTLSLCRSALLKHPDKRTAAISLECFLEVADQPDDIRRRLAPRRRTGGRGQALSALPWVPKVTEWIAAAAVLEKAVLGAHRLVQREQTSAHLWELHFDELGLVVEFSLSPAHESGALELALRGLEDGPSMTILRVTSDGPDIPEEQIATQLRDQVLYVLDTLPSGDEEPEAR